MKSKEKRQKKKKFSKGLIILLSVIGLILAILLSFSFIEDKMICDDSHPGDGWFCSYPEFIKLSPLTKLRYKSKCVREGGEFSTGFVEPGGGPYCSCLIPFSDYGEKCNYSEECSGVCRYLGEIPSNCIEIEDNTYSCPEDIEGICSKQKLGSCGFYKEVDGNIIYENSEICIF
jgi:hypothetical protein